MKFFWHPMSNVFAMTRVAGQILRPYAMGLVKIMGGSNFFHGLAGAVKLMTIALFTFTFATYGLELLRSLSVCR